MRPLLLLVAVVLALAGCGSDAEPSSDQSGAGTAATTSPPAQEASWPPPLPADVPTTGEHAWRATWTPDPDAELRFIDDLRGSDDGESTWGPGYVFPHADALIDLGYAICEDYYRGVTGEDEYNHLLSPAGGMPGPTEYDRAGQALDITMAARSHFCLNIDPWGEAY